MIKPRFTGTFLKTFISLFFFKWGKGGVSWERNRQRWALNEVVTQREGECLKDHYVKQYQHNNKKFELGK